MYSVTMQQEGIRLVMVAKWSHDVTELTTS